MAARLICPALRRTRFDVIYFPELEAEDCG